MFRRALIVLAAISLVQLTLPITAEGAGCPSAEVGGPTVGWIDTGSARAPIKRVTYPAGGVLDPPASNQVVGMSVRHRPLLSEQGTTVLTWHVRFGNGCPGTLNPIIDAPVGSEFTLTDSKSRSRTYVITEKHTVPKGRYDPAWFRSNGSPQVTLFTCTDLRQGVYRKTFAIIATPAAEA